MWKCWCLDSTSYYCIDARELVALGVVADCSDAIHRICVLF